ncbi:TadE/TadG family type IV pilus assembly protein [Agrobacterium sp. ES01]|uniref:TadE/TadG family type IV pilus assembly protein n=1 Tax=Agrobacterium sp. ES01 TaxID=3420714 RepID=UPI003D0C0F21
MATLSRFRNDCSGVGAIEFALIAPILIVTYLASFELTMGLSAVKRTTNSASVVADLISQKSSVTKAELATMEDVAKSIFAPYSVTGIKMKISGITISATNKATIAWSWANDGSTPYVKGSEVSLASNLLYPETFLVHSELSVPHELLMFMPDISRSVKNITISREYYYRQRVGDAGISCSDC